MQESDLTLEWIINNYGNFFQKYGISPSDIVKKYSGWNESNNGKPISEYLFSLLLEIGFFIAKSAETKEQGLEWKIEREEILLDFCKVYRKVDVRYYKRQLKFDKTLLQKMI